MTKLIEKYIWSTIYLFINIIVFLSIPMIGLMIINSISITENVKNIFNLVFGIPLVILLFYCSYLSKISADNKVDIGMSFWNARVAAYGTTFLYLSYLPVIGKYFIKKNKE